MAEFLTRLRLQYADDAGTEKEVVGMFVYRSDIPEVCAAYAGGLVIVEEGFRTDLASVPRLPLAFLLFAGVGDEAAVVHDKLYTDGLVSRKAADETFAEALKCAGVPAWRRGPMWFGVRLFGGSHFKGATEPPPLEAEPQA